MRLKSVKDQVVVLFGASSGIGRHAALDFASRGGKLMLAARGEPGLESLVNEIRERGGEVAAMQADAADFGQVKAVADATVARYGRLDTWVHLAGVGMWALFEDTDPEEYEQLIRVNLVGQMNGTKAALPYLKQVGGSLILISSVEARLAVPLSSVYAASKHGVHGFIRSLRMELQHEHAPVNVVEILPPSVNTPIFSTARSKMGVKAGPLPPVYPTKLITDAILHAATHPAREIMPGGAGKMMVLMETLAPRLTDRMIRGLGFTTQRTDQPKSPQDPDTLFGPVTDQDRVEGDFTAMAKLEATAPFLQRNRWIAGAAGLAAAAIVYFAVARR